MYATNVRKALFAALITTMAMLLVHTVLASGASTESEEIHVGPFRSVGLLVVSPKDPNVLYSISPSRCDRTPCDLYRTTNGGYSWQRVSSVLAASLSIDPTTPETLYIFTRDYAIWQSTDGGKAWITTSTYFSGSINSGNLYINPLTPTILYAATSRGLYRSEDGGYNWTRIHNGIVHDDCGISVLAINPLTPTTIYAGCSSLVYKTTDGGNSWQLVHDTGFQRIQGLAINPFTPTTVYIYAEDCLWKHSLYRSTNDGIVWEDISNRLPCFGSPSNRFFIDLQLPDALYFVCDSRWFKSTNNGEAWQQIGVLKHYEKDLLTQHGFAVRGILYAADGYVGVFRSTDGKSWQRADYGLRGGFQPAAHALATGARPGTIYVTYKWDKYRDSLGFFKTSDDGRNWSAISALPVTHNVSSIVVAPSNEKVVYISTFDFDIVPLPPPEIGTTFVFTSWILKSTDGGDNWSLMAGPFSPNRSARVLHVDPQDERIVYASIGRIYEASDEVWALAPGQFYRSEDGGHTWNIIMEKPIYSMAFFRPNPNIMYAGSYSGTVMKSVDRGRTWHEIAIPNMSTTTVRGVTVDAQDPNTIYVTLYPSLRTCGYIYRSTDGGATWENIAPDPQKCYFPAIADPYRPGVLYTGRGMGIYKSVDWGRSWQKIGTAEDNRSMALSWDGNAIYVGTPEGILRIATHPIAYTHFVYLPLVLRGQ